MNEDFKWSYRTREWERLKDAVLERDRHRCQICGRSDFDGGRLHVHHVTYERCGGVAYGAPMGDLITLCEYCHKHDDGDHQHFFDGLIRLHPYGMLPERFGGCRTPLVVWTNQWCFGEGVIISARVCDSSRRGVGFYTSKDTNNAWFPFMQGVDDHLWIQDDFDSRNFVDVRPANREEVERFAHEVDADLQWPDGAFRETLFGRGNFWRVNFKLLKQKAIETNALWLADVIPDHLCD